MNIDLARQNMLNHLKVSGVAEGVLLDAFLQIPRELFISDQYQDLAFADVSIPNDSAGELPPSLIAHLLLAADLYSNDSVLQVGTQNGYVTALLAKACQKVCSLGSSADRQAQIQKKLRGLNLSNVTFQTQSPLLNLPNKDAYDLILFSQGLDALPENSLQNLKPNGRIIAIIGESKLMKAKKITCTTAGQCHFQTLFETQVPYFSEIKLPSQFNL